jgi:hypothetical protein
MTPAVVVAVKVYLQDNKNEQRPKGPSLDAPEPGNPISHSQLIDISKYLKANPERARAKDTDDKDAPMYLNELMRGCMIYTPPPMPKAEPVRLDAPCIHPKPNTSNRPRNTSNSWLVFAKKKKHEPTNEC